MRAAAAKPSNVAEDSLLSLWLTAAVSTVPEASLTIACEFPVSGLLAFAVVSFACSVGAEVALDFSAALFATELSLVAAAFLPLASLDFSVLAGLLSAFLSALASLALSVAVVLSSAF